MKDLRSYLTPVENSDCVNIKRNALYYHTNMPTIPTKSTLNQKKDNLTKRWKNLEPMFDRMQDVQRTKILNTLLTRVDALVAVQKRGTDTYEILVHLRDLIQKTLEGDVDNILNHLLNGTND